MEEEDGTDGVRRDDEEDKFGACEGEGNDGRLRCEKDGRIKYGQFTELNTKINFIINNSENQS